MLHTYLNDDNNTKKLRQIYLFSFSAVIRWHSWHLKITHIRQKCLCFFSQRRNIQSAREMFVFIMCIGQNCSLWQLVYIHSAVGLLTWPLNHVRWLRQCIFIYQFFEEVWNWFNLFKKFIINENNLFELLLLVAFQSNKQNFVKCWQW